MSDAPSTPSAKKGVRKTEGTSPVSNGTISPPFADAVTPTEVPLRLNLTDEPKQSPPLLSLGSLGQGPSSGSYFGAPPAMGARRPTLLERRNKDRGMSVSGLCMDVIVDNTRDGALAPEEPPRVEFRGWSSNITAPTPKEEEEKEEASPATADLLELAESPKEPYSSKTGLKIVSYNILAARLVTTDRYPDCHPLILGEEYRIKLIKEEIKNSEADILILSEISTEVFEKTLGEFLRTQMNFYGEHVVITDRKGEPRCLPLGVPRVLDSIQPHLASGRGESASEIRTTPVLPAPRCSSTAVTPSVKKAESKNALPNATTTKVEEPRRVEMDGSAIFYNKNRFTLLERVAIRFNAIAQTDASLSPYERKKLQADSHNVALVVVLRDHLVPGRAYIIGAVHLIWQRVEAQLWQSNRLLSVVEQLKAKYQNGPSPLSPTGETLASPKGAIPSRTGSVDFSTQYSVSCILGGDFNVEKDNPTFSYLKTGVIPTEAPVFKSWRIEDNLSPVGPPERRTTNPFPSPPSVDKTRSPFKRGSPGPEPELDTTNAIPTAPYAPGRKRLGSSSGSALGETASLVRRSGNLIAPSTEYDPETPISTKKGSNPSSTEPSQTGGDQSSEIVNILSAASLTSPKGKSDGKESNPRPTPPEGSPSSGRGSVRLALSPINARAPLSLTHDLKFSDAYEGYCKRHPTLVSAVNPSTNMEGKVLDHILFEADGFECKRVMRLGKNQKIPNKDVPSDHYMIGAILEPRSSV